MQDSFTLKEFFHDFIPKSAVSQKCDSVFNALEGRDRGESRLVAPAPGHSLTDCHKSGLDSELQ